MSHQEFKSTVTLLKNKLYRFALGIVQHEAEAEDVVQEVFIKFWNNRENVESITSAEAWCMTATRNLCIDKLRSKHRRMEPLKSGIDFRDQSPTPFQKTVESDVLLNVNKLMDALPEKQKLVVRLRDIENYSYQEIAEILSLTLDQVKVNLFRARQMLRTQLVQLQLVESKK